MKARSVICPCCRGIITNHEYNIFYRPTAQRPRYYHFSCLAYKIRQNIAKYVPSWQPEDVPTQPVIEQIHEFYQRLR